MSIFVVKRGRVVDEDILSNATLNMDRKRIINVAYPRYIVDPTAMSRQMREVSDF